MIGISGPEGDRSHLLSLVSRWLLEEEHGDWLMILDNTDDTSVLFTSRCPERAEGVSSFRKRLVDFIPKVKHGAVLITSRSHNCALELVGRCSTPIEVPSMSLRESVTLLRTLLPDTLHEEGEELVRELQQNPLAISQAGAYIRQVTGVSIPIYLTSFRRSDEDQAALLEKHTEDFRRDPGTTNAVITSWKMSFDQIEKQYPRSAEILSTMSYFNRQKIPQMVLQGGQDDIPFYETMNPLISFSLVRTEIGHHTFEMHRLVQTAMRHWHKIKGSDQFWKNTAMGCLAWRYPVEEQIEEQWAMCEALMPHADEVLRNPISLKEAELRRAELLLKTADFLLQHKHRNELGLKRCTHALSIQRQFLDENSTKIRRTKNTLGLAYLQCSRLVEAKILLESLMTEERSERDDKGELISIHNLATVYIALRQYDKAEVLLNRVLVKEKELHGVNSGSHLASTILLCQAYRDHGKLEEAEKVYKIVLRRCRNTPGVRHSTTLSAMLGLANTYHLRSRYQDAEKCYLDVIEISATVHGRNSWRALKTKNKLASLYHDQKRLGEAEKICVDILTIAHEELGALESIITSTTKILGLIYMDQGKYGEAIELLQKVVEARGINHPSSGPVIFNIAVCHHKLGNYPYAIPPIKSLIKGFKSVPDSDRDVILMLEQKLSEMEHAYRFQQHLSHLLSDEDHGHESKDEYESDGEDGGGENVEMLDADSACESDYRQGGHS